MEYVRHSKCGLNHRARRMQSSLLELHSPQPMMSIKANGERSTGQALRHPGLTKLDVVTL